MLSLFTGSLDVANSLLGPPGPIPSLLAAHSTFRFYTDPIVSLVFGALIIQLRNPPALANFAASQRPSGPPPATRQCRPLTPARGTAVRCRRGSAHHPPKGVTTSVAVPLLVMAFKCV